MEPIVRWDQRNIHDNGYNGPPYLDNTRHMLTSDQMKSNKNFQIVGSDYQMSFPRAESRDTMSHNNSGQAARA